MLQRNLKINCTNIDKREKKKEKYNKMKEANSQ